MATERKRNFKRWLTKIESEFENMELVTNMQDEVIQRLWRWLRRHHPSVLNEYVEWCNRQDQKAARKSDLPF